MAVTSGRQGSLLWDCGIHTLWDGLLNPEASGGEPDFNSSPCSIWLMNARIRDKGRFIWALLSRNHKHVCEDASRSNQWLFLCTHYLARFHQRKWACFTRLVSVASSAFTTNSAREEWKALIVSLHLTQWLLNGLKPINQAVTRSTAAGSVTNSHKRQEPSAEQSLPTNWFSNVC